MDKYSYISASVDEATRAKYFHVLASRTYYKGMATRYKKHYLDYKGYAEDWHDKYEAEAAAHKAEKEKHKQDIDCALEVTARLQKSVTIERDENQKLFARVRELEDDKEKLTIDRNRHSDLAAARKKTRDKLYNQITTMNNEKQEIAAFVLALLTKGKAGAVTLNPPSVPDATEEGVITEEMKAYIQGAIADANQQGAKKSIDAIAAEFKSRGARAW